MKAVILVGGEGTRLRPLTRDVPKPMVPIVNKPYMEHQIDYLLRHGFNHIIFALGYKSEAFEQYFGNGDRWNARFSHVVESEPLGTAGAVKNVESLLDDTFLVFNGDVLSSVDLTGLVRFHRERNALGTLALTPVEDPSAYGVVVTDPDGRIRAFIEKPPREEAPTNAINAGIYVLEPEVVAGMPGARRWMFEHNVFPDLLRAGRPLYATMTADYWLDIGRPVHYLQANHDVLSGRAGVLLPSAEGGIWRGEAVRIDPTARVVGPVWIADGVAIEAGANILGPTVIGPNCRIGAATVSSSVVWAGSEVGAQARLEACMVGRNCRIGDGCVLESHSVLGSGEHLAPATHLLPGTRVPSA